MNVPKGPTARFRRWVYGYVPEWVKTRDFELFTLLLCIFGGIPLLLTQAVRADSMEASLPRVVVLAWGVVLVVAPLLVVFGARRSHYQTGLQSFKWIRWEVFGLRLLAYAAHLYAAIIVINSVTQEGVFQPAVIIIVIFGLTCTSRAWGLLDDIESFWQRMGVRGGVQ